MQSRNLQIPKDPKRLQKGTNQKRAGNRPFSMVEERKPPSSTLAWTMYKALIPFIPPMFRITLDTWSHLPSLTFIQTSFLLFLSWWTMTRVMISFIFVFGFIYIDPAVHGMLYLIVWGFIAILMNLRDRQGHEEWSAYSVFNRGGQRLMGQLTSEQFENEIRHRRPQEPERRRRPEEERQVENNENDEEMMLRVMQESMETYESGMWK